MYRDLVYDKMVFDYIKQQKMNTYSNKMTVSYSPDNLFDLVLLNDNDTKNICEKYGIFDYNLKNTIIDFDKLFLIKTYTKKIDHNEIFITIFSVNCDLLEKYYDNAQLSNNNTNNNTNNNDNNNNVNHTHNMEQVMNIIRPALRYNVMYNAAGNSDNICFINSNNSSDSNINDNIKFITDAANKIIDYTFDDRIKPIDLLNTKYSLFDYQKCSVAWMNKIESNRVSMQYSVSSEINFGNIYYNYDTKKFYKISDKKSITFYGGGLIDEVGLGKTLQIITLNLANPFKFDIDSNNKNNHYKCLRFSYKLRSSATLIICPNTLCNQWKSEFDKFLIDKHQLKIIKLFTKTDFDKLTYHDVLNADYVIVSFNFLINKCYIDRWTSNKELNVGNTLKKSIIETSFMKSLNDIIKIEGEKLINDIDNTLQQKNPLLHLITWNRLVVDEFHEIYSPNSKFSYMNNILKYISGNNKWIVTATPFINNEAFYGIFNYLTEYVETNTKIFSVDNIIQHTANHMFRKNTKQSVAEEHTLPKMDEEILWMNLSQTERLIYSSYLADHNNDKWDIKFRQLCCHPNLINDIKIQLKQCNNLNDVSTMMVQTYKDQCDEACVVVNKTKEQIDNIDEYITHVKVMQIHRYLKNLDKLNTIKSDQTKLLNATKIYAKEMQKYKNNLIITKPVLDTKISSTILNIWDNVQQLLPSSDTLNDATQRKQDKLNELAINTQTYEGKKTTYHFYINMFERLNKISKSINTKTTINNEIDIDDFLANLDDSDEEEIDSEIICSICKNIFDDQIGLTKCGHIYCFECIKMSIVNNNKCPYCRTNIGKDDLFVLSFDKKVYTEKEISKNQLISDHGTKIANLIEHIRNNPNEHMIIFSQWHDLLSNIGGILKKNNIDNIFCKGNVFQRSKAIHDFNNNDKCKIIMLSSDSAASGTNLTKASQIIFLDPIYGNKKFRKEQEKQAIGRAYRLGQTKNLKIIRFLIKNSIEEEIHSLNKIEDNNINEYELVEKMI